MPKEPGSRMESSSQTPDEQKQNVVDTQEMKALPSMMSSEVKSQHTAEEQKQINKIGSMIARGAEKEGYEKALSGVEAEIAALENTAVDIGEKPLGFFAKMRGMFRNTSRENNLDAVRREKDRQYRALEEKRDLLRKKIADIDTELSGQ